MTTFYQLNIWDTETECPNLNAAWPIYTKVFDDEPTARHEGQLIQSQNQGVRAEIIPLRNRRRRWSWSRVKMRFNFWWKTWGVTMLWIVAVSLAIIAMVMSLPAGW